MAPKEGLSHNGDEILIVEDSPTLAERLQFIVEGGGFKSRVAGNGREALELIGKCKPAMIISDILMPEMDGYEMCNSIKRDKDLKHIPVVLLTTLSDPKDVLRGLECGADNFITKPCGERYLVNSIRSIFANQDLREGQTGQTGIKISFAGEKYLITSDRQQILDFLLSTYEAAVKKNVELINARDELRMLNEQLEEKVKARTPELQKEVSERRRAEDSLRDEILVTTSLLEAAKVTSGQRTWKDIVYNVSDLLHKVTRSKGVFIFMLTPEGILIPQYEVGLPDNNRRFFYRLRMRAEDVVGCFKDIIVMKSSLLLKKEELNQSGLADYSEPLGLQELVLTPIIRRDKVLGIICVNFDELPSGVKMVDIIEGIARQLSVAYDNITLYSEAQNKTIELARSLETLKVLNEIDRGILSTMDSNEMMTEAVSQIRMVVPADAAGVLLLDEEAGHLRYSYGWCVDIKPGQIIPFEQCAGYPTIKSGKTLVRKNLLEEATISEMDKAMIEGGIMSDIFTPIICKGKGTGLLHVGCYRVAGFSLDEIGTAEKLATQIGIALENAHLLSNVEEMFINVVFALCSAIDAKSPWTKGHSERVMKYAVKIAEKMGLAQVDIDKLKLAALLHDIGKIGTFDVILDKPGNLTEDEFELVKAHPSKGCEILAPIKQFKDIIPVIRHHHERIDGKGYPDGLKGKDIPLLAKILCVSDSFDSMTADRPYRASPGVEYAIEEFNRCSGTQFDAKVIETFLSTFEEMGTEKFGVPPRTAASGG